MQFSIPPSLLNCNRREYPRHFQNPCYPRLIKRAEIVLRAANQLSDDVEMSDVKEQSYLYYQKALSEDSHVAYLVFDGNEFVGTGGISFFQVMPTFHNPTGNKAYIMNMYTKPEYRRKGIAYKTLDLLVAEAKQRGIDAVSLEATDMGKPLYKKYGFVKMNDEMELQ